MTLNIRQWLAQRNLEETLRQGGEANLAGIAFRLAQDMDSKSLNTFDISILADILEQPLFSVYELNKLICPLTVWLVRLFSRKKPLKRNEGTWLAFQIAYLNALQLILTQEYELKRPWLQRANIVIDSNISAAKMPSPLQSFPLNDTQLQNVLNTFRPGHLSDQQAEQALTNISESLLIQQMNSAAILWFIANGTEMMEARLLTQRLNHSFFGFLLEIIADNALPFAQLQKFVRLSNITTLVDNLQYTNVTENYTLNLEREHYRAQLLKAESEPVFMEYFTLKDIYVPLKGQVKMSKFNAEIIEGKNLSTEGDYESVLDEDVELMIWAETQLEETEKITLIEAAPGMGKTSFCQMFAAQIAKQFYPRWMPVFIRLKDVILAETLEQSLDSAFPLGKFTSNESWFSFDHPPCVIILDGLNELKPSPHTQRHLATFIEQLMKFHSKWAKYKRHKIILTNRYDSEIALCKAPGSFLPTFYTQLSILNRFVIQQMDKDQLRIWFQQWTKLQSKSIGQSYFSFLKIGGAFREKTTKRDINTLIGRPLIIYLLGILHRDGLLGNNIFNFNTPKLLFEMYQLLVKWLLGESFSNFDLRIDVVGEGLAHIRRSSESIYNLLGDISPTIFRQNMQAIALNILHRNYINFTEENLPDINLPKLFFKVNHQLGDKIEFSHSQLGKYLCAEAIGEKLKYLTITSQNNYGETKFIMDSPVEIAAYLYELLSYGILSKEIKLLIMEKLDRDNSNNLANFNFDILFDRLHIFYRYHAYGRWIDDRIIDKIEGINADKKSLLNTLKIDAIVGLNVFLILSAIAQTGNINFFPCGNPQISSEFDPDRFVTFINRIASLSPKAFWLRCCQGAANQLTDYSLSKLQLPGAALNHVMLGEAKLWQTNLFGAELISTNLSRANLQEANLSRANLGGANLRYANLSGANLEGADLSGANLLGVNLTLANLKNCCLFDVQIDENNRIIAKNKGAIFSLNEFQDYCHSLEKHKLNKHEEETFIANEMLLIASAEGEADYLNSYANLNESLSETMVLNNNQSQSENIASEEEDNSDDQDTSILENYWYEKE